MQVTPELGLVLALPGLYAWDALVPLRRNQVVLSVSGRGQWKPGFANGLFSMQGRAPCLSNLLSPWRPVFRLSWEFVPTVPVAKHAWEETATRFLPLGPWVAGLFVAMFVMLPIVLLARLGDAALLLAFGLIYLYLAAIGVQLWRHRIVLGLRRRRVLLLLLEFAVCPPFSLNVVRRLSLAQPVTEDFAAAAQRLLPSAMLPEIHAQIVARLDDEIAAEEEGSVRMKGLLQRRAGLVQACPR
jgi:hypothetical protein